jgi:hypothetical protein
MSNFCYILQLQAGRKMHDEVYSPECVEGLFCEVGLPLYGVLQRQSKRLNHSMVSAVLKEALSIPSADRRHRLTDRFDQCLAAASFGFP